MTGTGSYSIYVGQGYQLYVDSPGDDAPVKWRVQDARGNDFPTGEEANLETALNVAGALIAEDLNNSFGTSDALNSAIITSKDVLVGEYNDANADAFGAALAARIAPAFPAG